MPRQTLSDSECKKLPGRPVQLPIVRMRGRGGRRVAEEGKDQVAQAPSRCPAGIQGREFLLLSMPSFLVQAGSRAEEGPAPQVPQETPGGAEAHLEGRHGIL